MYRAILTALLLFPFFGTANFLHAQERLRLAWAGISPALSPIWAMPEQNFLPRQGVDAEVIAISSSITVIQALLSGEIDAASTGVNVLISSRLAGADTVMILSGVPTTLLDDIAVQNPKAAAADPRSFVDLTLVQELDGLGFIKQLYKR